MGKPRMIILIRHAQSEGNKNRDIHQTIPDHRVKLTPEGWTQAHEAGLRLRSLLRADDTLHFFTSPYRRTRETTEGILSTLTSDSPDPSPFPRHSIKVYEEPRLREQDFGNFQPCSAEMERMWQERADYGHFFYRIPNGESAADAYDRVSGFNESLWRQFGDDDFASVCVLVTHGLMSRVFLMKWYHFSVEYFEDLRNVNHCEFLIMRKSPDSGKYILENQLRTWSQLKKERLAAAAAAKSLPANVQASEKDKEKEAKLLGTSPATGTMSPIPTRKKWGGCPNGCDHGKHYYKKENSMHAMQLNGRVSTSPPEPLISRRPTARRMQSSSDEDTDDPRGKNIGPLDLDAEKSWSESISTPDSTAGFATLSIEDRLQARLKSPNDLLGIRHCGRDGGGSASGANSDAEFSAEEDVRKRLARGVQLQGTKLGRSGMGVGVGGGGGMVQPRKLIREEGGMGRGAKADALGDQSDAGSEGEAEEGGCERSDSGGDGELIPEMKELEREEMEDKSLRGSVY
ncbi:phosphoglycerate mutase protein [Rutstroemia sp. NJR-2017a WRK4]|nr:phosphoglycerate mutase protein [Rutstroemia sp. NJR-2017a WRK4]